MKQNGIKKFRAMSGIDLELLMASLAQEKLSFKNGLELASVDLYNEDALTRGKIRRILEKRVCQKYWTKNRGVQEEDSNRPRSATRRYVAYLTQDIYGTGSFAA